MTIQLLARVRSWFLQERSPTVQYGAALLMVGLAILAIQHIPVLGEHALFLFFFLAVLQAALWLGLRAGLFSIASSLIAVNFLFLLPAWSAAPYDTLILNAGFCLVALLICDTAHYCRQSLVALRESQHALNRAQEVARIGSWWLDNRRNELLWSDETHRIFGVPKGEPLTYETILAATHPEDREYVNRVWTAALRGDPYDIEHRIVVAGQIKWVRERAELEFDEQGRLLGGFGTVQDITERKLREAKLREQAAKLHEQAKELHDGARRKDAFLAMLGHELRNPLAPIRNALQIMRAIGPKEPRLDWARAVIDRQVAHMTHLVDELLDVSRITRGKVALQINALRLEEVVNQALDLIRPLIESRKQKLVAHLPVVPVWIKGDSTRLTQVVSNLLDNAAKYTPQGGNITLTVRVEGEEAAISVADTGNGISPELLPHIFELFTQGEHSLDRPEGGLGLGLALVKSLVDMHGGRVEAKSPGVGYGAEFVVRLPCLREGETRNLMASQAAGPKPQAEQRVLVVDDNNDVVNSLAFLFKLKGYEVKTAGDGPTALQLAQDFDFCAVVLDIGLPGMDGYEVCRRLRARYTENPPVIIALTGYGEKKDRERAKAAGFDHHLVKPADPEQLFALIEAKHDPIAVAS